MYTDLMSANFYRAIDAVAADRAAADCWIVPERGRWSFSGLRNGCGRFAHALQRLGVQPGDRVLAQVEKSPEALPGVIDGLRERLARFKQPKRVFFVDDLPRNALGKVQKNLLRERFRDTFD